MGDSGLGTLTELSVLGCYFQSRDVLKTAEECVWSTRPPQRRHDDTHWTPNDEERPTMFTLFPALAFLTVRFKGLHSIIDGNWQLITTYYCGQIVVLLLFWQTQL